MFPFQRAFQTAWIYFPDARAHSSSANKSTSHPTQLPTLPTSPTAAQCTLANISPPFQLHFTMHFSNINLLHIFCCRLWYQEVAETGSYIWPDIQAAYQGEFLQFSRRLQIWPAVQISHRNRKHLSQNQTDLYPPGFFQRVFLRQSNHPKY